MDPESPIWSLIFQSLCPHSGGTFCGGTFFQGSTIGVTMSTGSVLEFNTDLPATDFPPAGAAGDEAAIALSFTLPQNARISLNYVLASREMPQYASRSSVDFQPSERE
jgi:hypothetical protein